MNKGYTIHKLDKKPRDRNVNKKGRRSARGKFVHEVIREVAGFAPYERRLIDLCRNNLDKRALRLAKKKLGAHGRAKRKREEMSQVAFRLRQEAARKEKELREKAKAEGQAANK